MNKYDENEFGILGCYQLAEDISELFPENKVAQFWLRREPAFLDDIIKLGDTLTKNKQLKNNVYLGVQVYYEALLVLPDLILNCRIVYDPDYELYSKELSFKEGLLEMKIKKFESVLGCHIFTRPKRRPSSIFSKYFQ